MTHFLGKAPVVFKTKELSNVLEKQLKNLMTHFINKLYRQSLLQIQVHQIGSYVVDKISLSCFDDKRYIHENGETSYAYGFENSEIFWV